MKKRNKKQCGLIAVLFFLVTVAQAQPPGVEYDWQKPDNGIPNDVFEQRRASVRKLLSEKAALLVFSADIRNRQNDVDFEYRQYSNLLYLTGYPYASAALWLSGNSDADKSQQFFVQERNVSKELWTGVTPGVKLTRFAYGIPTQPYNKLKSFLEEKLPTIDTLFYTHLPTPTVIEPFSGDTISLLAMAKKFIAEKYPHVFLKPWSSNLALMREIKDSSEIVLLQRAVDITVAGFNEVLRQAKAPMTETELEGIMEGTFKRQGALEVGYPSIVGAGKNACILHYIDNNDTAQAGELVLMDCGAEYKGYTADITRTFPINGKFSEEQKILYNIVLEAQDSAIAECTAGSDWRKPHSAAVSVLRKGLLALGIITKPEEYRYYYPHGTSHALGLDVHDANTYKPFRAGIVLTVEPGIYIPHGSPCDQKWWGIGIRIEDNILVTEGKPQILSAGLARTIAEIEQMMANSK